MYFRFLNCKKIVAFHDYSATFNFFVLQGPSVLALINIDTSQDKPKDGCRSSDYGI